jgi:nucleotide-binding universal stress UspA family protein
MTVIQSVLAATDFSPDATHASRRAAMVAAEHNATLDLLHVLEPDIEVALRDWLAADRDLRSRIEEQADMQLAAMAQQLTEVTGIPVRRQLRHGTVLNETAGLAAQASLLVLGARGTHTWRRVTLGTTAERLMRTVSRPLLVVRQPPAASYARVLVLTDFSAAAEAALHMALAVAPRAAIHLVHAFDAPFEGKLRIAGVPDEQIAAHRAQALADASRRLQEHLRGPEGHRVHVTVASGDPRVEGLRMIDELGADLVAVGKQGTSLLGDMFLGSTTSCMIAHAPCDVLGVPSAATAAAS